MQTRSSEDTETPAPTQPATVGPQKADTAVPQQPARRTRQPGVPARPALVAALNVTVTAGAGLHQAAGMPGLAAGVAVAGSTALLSAALRGRRGARRSAGRSAKAATVAAGRSRGVARSGKGAGAATGRSATGSAPRSASGRGVAPARGATGRAATGSRGARPSATGSGGATSATRSGKRHGSATPATLGGATAKGATPGKARHGKPGGATPAKPKDAVRKAAARLRRASPAGTPRTSGTATPGTGAAGRTRRGTAARVASAVRHPVRTTAQAARRLNERRKAGSPRRAEARKRIAKATGRGLLASAAGIVSALFQLSPRHGWATVRRVWAKRTAKSRAKSAPQPEIADNVREPKTPTTAPKAAPARPAATRGAAVSRFVEAAAEMAGAASAYSPTGMVQVGNDLARVPEALQHIADAIRITVQQAHGQFPIHPQIIEMLGGVYKQIQQAASSAQELTPAFRTLHGVDLQRHETPRVGEQMWDISANR